MISTDPIDMTQVDYVHQAPTGYPDNVAKGDTLEAMRGAAGDALRSFPASLWVEQRDWAVKSAENDANKTWPINYIDRFTNQNPTDECTCHSERTGFEAARNRARGVIYGGPVAGKRLEASALYGSVWVAPLSAYAEANPGQRGGAGCRQVLEIVVRRGFLPETIQPAEYGFHHALHGTTGKGGVNQATGPWVPLSKFPEGWRETAANFRVLEVIIPESWEEIVCLVLAGMVVNVGRSGHAIPYSIWLPDKELMGYVDSYDVVRYDSVRTIKSAVGGASAIATVTTPDDWSKPAG